MDPNSFIRVRAAKFAIMEGEEDELVNEGMYGKAFALYLRAQLALRDHAIPGVVCEDWGWWVTIGGLPFRCGLCVYGTRMEGSDDLDLCVTVSTPAGRVWSWRKFGFIDTTPDIRRLYWDIRAILHGDPDVTVLGEAEDFPLG